MGLIILMYTVGKCNMKKVHIGPRENKRPSAESLFHLPCGSSRYTSRKKKEISHLNPKVSLSDISVLLMDLPWHQ